VGRLLLVLGLIAALTGCKGRSAPPLQDQRVPDRSIARAPAPARARPDVGPPGPLALRRLTVAGFQRAERVEREDEEAHWGRVSTRSFSLKGEGQEWKRVVEIRLGRRSPRSLKGYLRHWRASHGCTAKEVRDLPKTMRGSDAPPQLTFAGVCKGGDAYIIRVLLLDDTAYELHADSYARGGPPRPRFLELLSAVQVPASR